MARAGWKSRRVVSDGAVRPGVVLVRDGVIEAVAAEGPPGVEIHDFGDAVISPGLVDAHVHVNEPGRTDWEGFATATRAAAGGGVTTIVDMPLNSLPVTTTAAAFQAKREAAVAQCHVDVGFWGGVVPGNGRDLGELAAAGVLGCKAFLVHSGIDEFPNVDEADLRAAMPILRDAGLPLLAHAELDLGARVTERDPRRYAGYLQSRPRAWEDAAIGLLIALCRETGCPVHIVHLSSASALPALRSARADGLPVTVETCPHYLCLDAESIPDGATHFKCAPPIRERENREALWRALFDGVIDFVITDHSPCLPELKLAALGDFTRAWGGIASLQLGLSAVWTEARRRGAGPLDLACWMSAAPASFAGIADRKGRIAPGLDADLVIWDPDARYTVRSDQLHFRHPVSPYVGVLLEGRVLATVLRGTVVYEATGAGAGRHPVGPHGRLLLDRAAPAHAPLTPRREPPS
ncbi:MAG: allantoinase AllB [Myxococcales bacterium]|nr:allantoinase AllB [Myxococcales bacterium]